MTVNRESIVITDDNPEPMYFHPKSTSSIYTIYRTEQTPAVIEYIDEKTSWAKSHASYPKFSSEGGAIFRSVDYPPNFETVSRRHCSFVSPRNTPYSYLNLLIYACSHFMTRTQWILAQYYTGL